MGNDRSLGPRQHRSWPGRSGAVAAPARRAQSRRRRVVSGAAAGRRGVSSRRCCQTPPAPLLRRAAGIGAPRDLPSRTRSCCLAAATTPYTQTQNPSERSSVGAGRQSRHAPLAGGAAPAAHSCCCAPDSATSGFPEPRRALSPPRRGEGRSGRLGRSV